jgi:drug/metabolite transporter (DMT)-like permease
VKPSPGPVLLVCTFVWASTFIVTKDMVAGAPPFLYLTLRYGIAAVLLLPLMLKKRAALDRRFWTDALVIAAFASVGLAFQVLGQVYTSASKSAFITSLNTPLTALVGLLLYRSVPTRAQRVGVALATLGLLLLSWPRGASGINPGDLLTVGAAVLFSFYIVEAARRAPRHDAVALSVVQVVAGALFFALACGTVHVLAQHGAMPAELARLELRPFPHGRRVAVELAYMSIVCVAIITLVQTWAMQRLTATTAAVIFAIEPVVATLIAVAVDGDAEWPGPRGVAGAFCVLCAVYVAERRSLGRRGGDVAERSEAIVEPQAIEGGGERAQLVGERDA